MVRFSALNCDEVVKRKIQICLCVLVNESIREKEHIHFLGCKSSSGNQRRKFLHISEEKTLFSSLQTREHHYFQTSESKEAMQSSNLVRLALHIRSQACISRYSYNNVIDTKTFPVVARSFSTWLDKIADGAFCELIVNRWFSFRNGDSQLGIDSITFLNYSSSVEFLIFSFLTIIIVLSSHLILLFLFPPNRNIVASLLDNNTLDKQTQQFD